MAQVACPPPPIAPRHRTGPRGLSMMLSRHPPPGPAPEDAVLPPPPSRWGGAAQSLAATAEEVETIPVRSTQEVVKESFAASSSEQRAEYHTHMDNIQLTMNSILARLDGYTADIESLQQKQERLSQLYEKGEAAHRAQLECVTERVYKAEKDLHEAQQRQEDAIEKASAAFKKHAWDVMQDRQHLMMAIDQVNKNFAEVTCTIADNNNEVKVMQTTLAQFSMELDQVSQAVYNNSGSVQTTQQQLEQLQYTVQAVHDTVVQMTPQSQFVEVGSAQRALAEQCNELQTRMQEIMGELTEDDAEFQGGMRSKLEGREFPRTGLVHGSRQRMVHVTPSQWEDAEASRAPRGVSEGRGSSAQPAARSPRTTHHGTTPVDGLARERQDFRCPDVSSYEAYDGDIPLHPDVGWRGGCGGPPSDFEHEFERPLPGPTILGGAFLR
mmetsp:Transcript_76370/g.181626  ORF Transcript_76370/g.181626 Transcript_76370/m.181626 type:complete len:439 (-) Transcript_76370:189-1505(-)